MYREIRKKMIILGNRFPFTKEVSSLIKYMQKRDWIYLNMKLEGSQITQVELEQVLQSDTLINIPIEEYILIRRLEDLFAEMVSWARKGLPISRAMIENMYQICSQEKPVYRRSNPVILQWSFTPILPQDIDHEIDILTAKSKEEVFDPLKKAVSLHNDFLKIYPYGKFNEIIARGLMYYTVMLENLPLAKMKIKEEEYNHILYEELNKGCEQSQLYDFLVKATLDTLNVIDSLTKRDN